MGEVWSSGVWTVKPGREAEFAEGWREFAEWATANHDAVGAWLLRDRDRPSEYISIGPWPSDAALAAWRADPGFGSRVARLRELLDGFEPRTLDPVVSVGVGPRPSG
jgi:heme-degrading monooxygenase HmoA